jgi:hypothetical protein
MSFRKFLSDLYTGPDGQTWALGRIYSIPILLTGVAAPILTILRSHASGIPLGDVGLELGGVAAAVGAMVAVTNHIDNTPGVSSHALLPSVQPS